MRWPQYGGLVTVMSMQLSGRSRISFRQSPWVTSFNGNGPTDEIGTLTPVHYQITIVRIISNGRSGAGDTLTVARSWGVLVLLRASRPRVAVGGAVQPGRPPGPGPAA